MIVRVRLFARQRELVGTSRLALELPDGATIDAAWSALAARFPELAPARPYVRFARNGVYADAADALADGDELACIPPVSGGAGEAPAEGLGEDPPRAADPPTDAAGRRIRRLALTPDPIDERALGLLREAIATPSDGAVVTFEGRTRETPGTPAPGEEPEAARHRGKHVRALDYEAYDEMALATLEAIADEIERRFEVCRIGILHRTGRVPLGEASVVVVVASPHRDRAFAACRYAIDELKARAPIWKAEQFADGTVWIGAPARPTAPTDEPAGPAASAAAD